MHNRLGALTGFQVADDIVFRPGAQPGAGTGEIDGGPLSVKAELDLVIVHTATQCPTLFFRTQDIARRMAGPTVAGTFHQIGAAVPFIALPGVLLKGRVVMKQPLPTRQQRTQVIGKVEFIALPRRVHRLQTLQKEIQRGDIFVPHPGVVGVRERRVKVVTFG